MPPDRPLNIGITCYPSVGGSGILASALGEELARRGHSVHFISYERPFRLSADSDRLHFHPVAINDYGLFKYPDYTLPLSVKMAEVSRTNRLDILHVHYAVPHATAAILARTMLAPGGPPPPKIVTTLHGTDTTLLGHDAGYGPAIRHALVQSDAVTAVSAYLERETRHQFDLERPIEVIHNFYVPRPPGRSRSAVRTELGVRDGEVLIVHSSNLRPLKRIDTLLETVAKARTRHAFKLVILAGESFAPYAEAVNRLGLADRIIVRERVDAVEDYLHAADLGLYTSEMESFCLSILEGMYFACPSLSTAVGGIPEVVEHNRSGVLVPLSDPVALTRELTSLIDAPDRRADLGRAARTRAATHFSADIIVPQYEALYRRTISQSSPFAARA